MEGDGLDDVFSGEGWSTIAVDSMGRSAEVTSCAGGGCDCPSVVPRSPQNLSPHAFAQLSWNNTNTFFSVSRAKTLLSNGSLRLEEVRYTSITSLARLTSNHLVVLLKSGPSAGKIAVIAQIIDHNRVRSPQTPAEHPVSTLLFP